MFTQLSGILLEAVKGRAKYANFSTLQLVNIGCNLDSPQITNTAAETGYWWQPERSRNFKDTWATRKQHSVVTFAATLHVQIVFVRSVFCKSNRQRLFIIVRTCVTRNGATTAGGFFVCLFVLFISDKEPERGGRARVARSIGSDTYVRFTELTAACVTWLGASFCQWEPSLSLPWSSSAAASSRYSRHWASSRPGFSACIKLFDSPLAGYTYLPFLFTELSLIVTPYLLPPPSRLCWLLFNVCICWKWDTWARPVLSHCPHTHTHSLTEGGQ